MIVTNEAVSYILAEAFEFPELEQGVTNAFMSVHCHNLQQSLIERLFH